MESAAAFISLLERLDPTGLNLLCYRPPDGGQAAKERWVLFLRDDGGRIRGAFSTICRRDGPLDNLTIYLDFDIWMLTEVVPPSQDLGVPANEGRQLSMLRINVGSLASSSGKTVWRYLGHGLAASGYDLGKCMKRVVAHMHPLIDILWNNPTLLYEPVLDPPGYWEEDGDGVIGPRADRDSDSIYWELEDKIAGIDLNGLSFRNYIFLTDMSLCNPGYERRYDRLGFEFSLIEEFSDVILGPPRESPELLREQFRGLLRCVPTKVQLVARLWTTLGPDAKERLAHWRIPHPGSDLLGPANSEANRLVWWFLIRAAKEFHDSRDVKIFKSIAGFLKFYDLKTRFVQEVIERKKSQIS